MNKELITDAFGFVGKNLIEYLHQKYLDTLAFSRSEVYDYTLIDPIFLNHHPISSIIRIAWKAHELRRGVNGEG
ncbi:MAG: hypothetical protein EBX50_22290 [Chitinophagia bacterium]|nr:hypothetical protein [Chitinophagia bacterium]